MVANFDTLPEEVIIHIFKELSRSDILNCTLVSPPNSKPRRGSHLTRHVVDMSSLPYDHPELCDLYQLELAVAGMHDVEGQDLAVADRLAQLKTVQDGWSNLRFRQRRQIPFNLGPGVWEMFGGVLAQGMPGPMVRGLAFTELPSAVNRASGHTWEHRDLGVDIRDFAMDSAQDLLVLIALPVAVR
jgi:F-box-like